MTATPSAVEEAGKEQRRRKLDDLISEALEGLMQEYVSTEIEKRHILDILASDIKRCINFLLEGDMLDPSREITLERANRARQQIRDSNRDPLYYHGIITPLYQLIKKLKPKEPSLVHCKSCGHDGVPATSNHCNNCGVSFDTRIGDND